MGSGKLFPTDFNIKVRCFFLKRAFKKCNRWYCIINRFVTRGSGKGKYKEGLIHCVYCVRAHSLKALWRSHLQSPPWVRQENRPGIKLMERDSRVMISHLFIVLIWMDWSSRRQERKIQTLNVMNIIFDVWQSDNSKDVNQNITKFFLQSEWINCVACVIVKLSSLLEWLCFIPVL